MTRRRVIGMVVATVSALILIGLGVYLWRVGLDRADRLGSVIGAFAGLIGLGLGAVQAVRARSTPDTSTTVTNSISGNVTGNVTQAGHVGGDVDMRQAD